jgi:hypothetical protein
MPHIFLSYCRDDQAIARRFAPITLPRGSTRTAFLPGSDAAAQLVVIDLE